MTNVYLTILLSSISQEFLRRDAQNDAKVGMGHIFMSLLIGISKSVFSDCEVKGPVSHSSVSQRNSS